MTLSLRRSFLPRVVALTVAGVVAVAVANGCEDGDVGIRCPSGEVDPGSSAQAEEQGTFSVSYALECRSRICALRKSAETPVPRCTKLCQGDGDCPSQGPNCRQGFACRVGGVKVYPGLDCCKLCVCKDDLSVEELQSDPQDEICQRTTTERRCTAF